VNLHFQNPTPTQPLCKGIPAANAGAAAWASTRTGNLALIGDGVPLTRGRAPVPCRRLDGLPRLASSWLPSHGERSQPVPSHRTLALPSPNPTNTGRFRYSVSEVPIQLSNLIARPPLSRFEEPWADRAFVRVAVLIIFLFLFPFYFTLRNWGNCTVQC